jgi:hypothetical protein
MQAEAKKNSFVMKKIKPKVEERLSSKAKFMGTIKGLLTSIDIIFFGDSILLGTIYFPYHLLAF